MLTGNIDRLVLLYHADKIIAADLIDYKTDRIDPEGAGAVAAKVDFYRPQVAAYRRAVSRMLRLEKSRIVARLLFLGLDRVECI
jgi:ATP-dependent exoDNAse (exonuclease V) beta subunit